MNQCFEVTRSLFLVHRGHTQKGKIRFLVAPDRPHIQTHYARALTWATSRIVWIPSPPTRLALAMDTWGQATTMRVPKVRPIFKF